MSLALEQAKQAAKQGETPVGAVIVYQNELIAAQYNRREMDRSPIAHAEMLAIRQASERLGVWRLSGCTLYVTLEPCPMCAGALVLARIGRLVFGARDPKAGCAGSMYNLVQDVRFNHRLEVCEGVLAEPCSAILSEFFSTLRAQRRDGRVVDCARLESE